MKILIEYTDYHIIMTYASIANGEISGLARAKIIDNQTVKVYAPIILKQDCSSAETTLDPDDLSKYLEQRIKEGDNLKDLKCWWHSHDNMSVFWSTTDDENIETLSSEWSVSIVVNKSKEVKARIDIYKPLRSTSEAEVEVYTEGQEDLYKILEAEVAEKLAPEKKIESKWSGYKDDEGVTLVCPVDHCGSRRYFKDYNSIPDNYPKCPTHHVEMVDEMYSQYYQGGYYE